VIGAREHCGKMVAVAALAERARSARRANILPAIVAKVLLVYFTCILLVGLNKMGDGLTTNLVAIYTHGRSCISARFPL
jgi:hypothetical protein